MGRSLDHRPGRRIFLLVSPLELVDRGHRHHRSAADFGKLDGNRGVQNCRRTKSLGIADLSTKKIPDGPSPSLSCATLLGWSLCSLHLLINPKGSFLLPFQGVRFLTHYALSYVNDENHQQLSSRLNNYMRGRRFLYKIPR